MNWYRFSISPIDNPEVTRLQRRLINIAQALGDAGGPSDGAAMFSRNVGDTVTLYFTEPAVQLLKTELSEHDLVPCDTPEPGPEESIGMRGVLCLLSGDEAVWEEIEGRRS